jgi:O-antigen/teichoic acid export membrane protein
MLKKAIMLVSGNAAGSLLLLLRNLVVARLLSPEDYGIAATFAIAMSIVEMVSYLGLQQLIVVDKDGDDPHVQAAMQGFQAIRGLGTAVLLYLVAGLYSSFLGIAEVAWAYQVLALVPLISGFQHFDIHRLKRHLRFGPSIISATGPALVALISIWPLAGIYTDYRVMLASLLIQAAAMVLLSHLAAERPYRLAFDPALIRRSIRFGWPLLLNGILLFAIFNGEKLIVGRELGMAALAIFSMGFTLTLTPTLVLGSSIQSFFLPILGAVRDREDEFQKIAAVTMEAGFMVGMLLILGISLVGGPVVGLLLGEKYNAILSILVPLSVLQGVRVSKTGSSLIALARERSGNAAASNLFRVAALPIAWWIAVTTGNVIAIIWVGVAAETLGFSYSLFLARSRAGFSLRPVALSIAMCALAYAVVEGVSWVHPPQATFSEHLHPLHLAVVLACTTAFLSMTGLRRFLYGRLLAVWRGDGS